MIRFGPAGIGGVKDAVSYLENYKKIGFGACEIPFTYQIFIKSEKDALEIGKKARELGIRLSIHAPYWINLNSAEKKKIEESKKRILGCCKIGEVMGAETVVFHAGFYGKLNQGFRNKIPDSAQKSEDFRHSATPIREQAYQNIKKAVSEMLEEIKRNRWKIKIAAETMGKINVFGSTEEILRLVKETGCYFCLDFAHLWAREQGKVSYSDIYENFKNFPELHCHFSGIDFGEKGERNHKPTPDEEIKKLLKVLPRNKEITIINEAPNPIQDSEKMLRAWERLV